MLQPPGEVGVFFLGHAGLDYMAAVGRVVSLGYGYQLLSVGGLFRRGGLFLKEFEKTFPLIQYKNYQKRVGANICKTVLGSFTLFLPRRG